MLEKYKIPHQIQKFIILDSMSFETNARLDPYFTSNLTLTKKMTTSFFTRPTCFTYIIINKLRMSQVCLLPEDTWNRWSQAQAGSYRTVPLL